MNVGLIGYGNIAKKHEAAISDLRDFDLKGIHDIKVPDNPSTPFYTQLEDLLAEEIDIITICSPNGFHPAQAIKCLENKKHVICEKPLALTQEDSDNMIAAARKNQRQLFCTMQNRYSPVSQWLRQLIDNNSLGDIYIVNVACYWNRNKNYYKNSEWRGHNLHDGGTLFTQFSHYVDTILWLLGDIDILNAHLKNYDHEDMIDFEDTGVFNFSLQSGGMGTFSYTTSCYEKNFESSMTIIGSKGTVKIAGQYMDSIEYCNVKDITPPTIAANDNLSNIQSVYKNALRTIESGDNSLSSAMGAKDVVGIIEKVYSFR